MADRETHGKKSSAGKQTLRAGVKSTRGFDEVERIARKISFGFDRGTPLSLLRIVAGVLAALVVLLAPSLLAWALHRVPPTERKTRFGGQPWKQVGLPAARAPHLTAEDIERRVKECELLLAGCRDLERLATEVQQRVRKIDQRNVEAIGLPRLELRLKELQKSSREVLDRDELERHRHAVTDARDALQALHPQGGTCAEPTLLALRFAKGFVTRTHEALNVEHGRADHLERDIEDERELLDR